MSKKFRLTVSDAVGFEVKGKLNDGGARPLDFRFRVTAERIPVQTYREALAPDSGITTRDFIHARLRSWSGQTLVIDEDGVSADLCPESLDVMLSLVGMEGAILGAYLEALTVASTAEGRAKN